MTVNLLFVNVKFLATKNGNKLTKIYRQIGYFVPIEQKERSKANKKKKDKRNVYSIHLYLAPLTSERHKELQMHLWKMF